MTRPGVADTAAGPANDSFYYFVQPCRACGGRGGFNFFDPYQGEGTTVYWVHRWVPCALCGGHSPKEVSDAPKQTS